MNIIQSLKNYLSHQTTIPSLKLIKTFPSLFLNQSTHVYVVDEVNVIHPHYWIRCGEHFFPDYMLLDFCEQFAVPISQIKQIAHSIQFNLNNLEYNSYYHKQYIANYKLDGITTEQLLELFNQEDIEFCQYLIKSPIIENHQAVLQELIKHKNPEIRKLVPQSEFVTEEQLQILTHDNRIKTFLNEQNTQSTVFIKNVTSIILEAIDNNDDEAITRFLKANHEFDLPALATYPHLTQEQVQLLMYKGGSKTRAVLSCSPKITKEQFQTLLSSKDSLICQMATNSCHIEEKDLKILMSHSNLNVVIAVAKSHFVTERILRELMNHENEQVRIAVASSPNVTQNILKKLVLDSANKSNLVLETVAASSHSNSEILFTLINETDYNVRKNTVNNPNVNNRILKCFLNDKSAEIQNVAKTLLLYQHFTK